MGMKLLELVLSTGQSQQTSLRNVNNLAKGIAVSTDGIALVRQSRRLLYDILGVTKGYGHAGVMHSLQTNIHFEEGELCLFQESKKHGC